METLVPAYIRSCEISSAADAELMTICRLFGVVTDFALVTMQNRYRGIATEGGRLLRRVEKELIRRRVVHSASEIYAIPDRDVDCADLSVLSIAELEQLFRLRPRRYETRKNEGLELLTRYFETAIVNELGRRQPSDRGERLMIDYCRIVNRLELENVGFILRLPIGEAESDKYGNIASAEELATLIAIHAGYRTLNERERLVNYVDMAVEMLCNTSDTQSLACLASVLLDLDRQNKVKCPDRVNGVLRDSISSWIETPLVDATKMVIPMLTLEMLDSDYSLGVKARKIVNRCYNNCLAGEHTLDELYTAVVCSTYVTRFSPRRMALCWNSFCDGINDGLSSLQICRLLESAMEMEDFVTINQSIKQRLLLLLSLKAKSCDPVAVAFLDKVMAHPHRNVSLAV